MPVSKTLFSSNSDEWSTPQAFYEKLDAEFDFTLDPCCTIENHKTDKFYTAMDDGLSHDWGGNECSLIHLIAISVSGFKSAMKNLLNQEHLSCC